MNAKTLAASLALSLAAASAFAAETPRATRIVDLPAVTVRPTAAQKAEYLAVQAMQARIVDLATVYVQPTAEQLAERASIAAREQAGALAAQVGHMAEQAASSANVSAYAS